MHPPPLSGGVASQWRSGLIVITLAQRKPFLCHPKAETEVSAIVDRPPKT